MTQGKCNGCKVFTLCLGDIEGFLENGPIQRCGYCRTYFIEKTWFPHEEFCREFHTITRPQMLDPGRHSYLYSVCHHENCKRLAKRGRDNMNAGKHYKANI